MPSIDFPVSPDFPSPQVNGYGEGFVAAYLEEQNAGIHYRRKEFDKTFEVFSFTTRCTTVQKNNMDYFYKTTTKGGTLSFNWTHPQSLVVFAVKFKTPPDKQYKPSFGSSPKDWIWQFELVEVGA